MMPNNPYTEPEHFRFFIEVTKCNKKQALDLCLKLKKLGIDSPYTFSKPVSLKLANRVNRLIDKKRKPRTTFNQAPYGVFNTSVLINVHYDELRNMWRAGECDTSHPDYRKGGFSVINPETLMVIEELPTTSLEFIKLTGEIFRARQNETA